MIQVHTHTLYQNNNDKSYQPSMVEDILFIELGQYYIAAFVQSVKDSIIHWFEFKQYTDNVTPELVAGYIARMHFDASSFEKSYIIHNSKDALLVPAEHHVEHLDKLSLETVSGDLFERVIKNENVFQWEIVNVYGVEEFLYAELNRVLPNAIHLHSNSIYLKSIFKQLSEMHDQWMKVYFYPSFFTVLAIKDEKLQLLQSYFYETPEDVIYQLLNITSQLLLDVTSVYVQVSGLIEEDSLLYTEMRKNFLEISLEESSIELNNTQNPMPSHYFTPIFLSPLCV